MPSNSLPTLRTLDTLKVGQRGTVVEVAAADPLLHHRLLTMGVVRGTPLTVEKCAPLGCPISVSLLGFELSLRKSEARAVVVSIDEISGSHES